MPLAVNGIVGTDRGGEPAAWHHASMTPEITFTWHHTIPWNNLRDVWNGLVDGKYWNAVSKFLYLVGTTAPAPVITAIKAEQLQNRDALHTQLTWQGWNIVEGPGNEYRTDDPGEAYDEWSGVGMSANQKSTYQAVAILYTTMKQVNALPKRTGTDIPQIKAILAKKLETAFGEASGPLRGKSPMPWNEAMWFRVTEGRIDKKLPRVWYTKPAWGKRLATDPPPPS
jgi:hypothetical protein